MSSHHLILGEITDFLTGQRIPNTHDEQYRQKFARFLVDDLKYQKTEIRSGITIPVNAGNKTALAVLDFAVVLEDRILMIIKYGPGSLVTRHRLSLAMSRILGDCQIPIVVVTNGEDADVLNGGTGKLMGAGFAAIPSRSDLLKTIRTGCPDSISSRQREMESRIVYAFEIDDRCPCDTSDGSCDRAPTFENNHE